MSDSRVILGMLEAARHGPEVAVARYCEAFKACGLNPRTFALQARAIAPMLTRTVLDVIGMHPSSEPELAALQRCYS